jgi:AcrR family transcriptional regulator
MVKSPHRAAKREEALTRAQIVTAAIELLDEEGENGLTFRALATRLTTGSGALYWHIANKDELLVAATDAIVADVLANVTPQGTPRLRIRNVAVAVFDAIDAHPWVGAQLSRGPWQTATLRIFERIGRELQALRVREGAQFTAAASLVSYILGVSGQNAGNRRTLEPGTDRAEILEQEAARWLALDVQEFSFTRSLADQLRTHDDREEFLAGIDLILAGIDATLGMRRNLAKRAEKP